MRRECVYTKRYATRFGCDVLEHAQSLFYMFFWAWLRQPVKDLFLVVGFVSVVATYHHTTGERNSPSAVRVRNNVTVANT